MNNTVFYIDDGTIINGANILKIYRDNNVVWFVPIVRREIISPSVVFETPEIADETIKFIMTSLEHNARVIKIYTKKEGDVEDGYEK